MNAREMGIWVKRWQTLKNQINELKEKTESRRDVAGLNDSQEKAIKSLEQLLVSLIEFADQQFEFFRNEFNGKPPVAGKTTEFPQEHVMRVTLDQIGHDLSVISQAINQRFSSEFCVPETLAVADYLGWYALKPAANAFDLEETRVICYLEKSPSVRVIPYARVALIGIPQTVVGAAQKDVEDFGIAQDLLAIPHEVAHYVFWNGLVNKSQTESAEESEKESIAVHLQRAVDESDRQLETYQWLEEMFADIYGCFVAGPVIALSFQDLHMRQSQTAFFRDDQDHPPSILRPHIYNKVLDKIDYGEWAALLRNRWLAKVDDRRPRVPPLNGFKNFGDQFITRRDDRTAFIDVGDVISSDPAKLEDCKPAEKLISLIYNSMIQELDVTDNWWRDELGAPPGQAEVASQRLYEKFDEKIRGINLDKCVVAEIEGNIGNKVPYNVLSGRWNSIERGNTDPGWLRRFDAGGWTTEGPECDIGSGSC